MSFERPALSEIINRTRDDIVSRLQAPDLLRRCDGEVYARAIAGAAHGLYGYLDWQSKQLIYDTADSDILERWASIWGVPRKMASYAAGTVNFTGANGAMAVAGTKLSAYDGQIYTVTTDVTVAVGSALATVSAAEAGVSGNRQAGQTFTLVSPVGGITASAVAGAMTGGADIEDYDSLRSRLLARIKQPPHGGSQSDYVAWALAVPGVTRAWAYPLELGAGTVTVRFMMDNNYIDGIPLAADVTAVASYIAQLRPVTAAVTVVAPVSVPLNLTIALTPPTAAVKVSVTQELLDLIAREATPGGVIYLSHIREVISAATGEFDHVLTTPSANVTNLAGNIATLGTITWA